MLRHGLILIVFYFSTFSCLAIESFQSIKLPSENALQLPVDIQQDTDGQIWLISEASISLFTSNKFVQYKDYDLPSAIKSALVLESGFFIATNNQLFFSSKFQSTEPDFIWQSPTTDEHILSLHQTSAFIFILTDKSVYRFDKTSVAEQISVLYSFERPVIDWSISGQHLYFITANGLTILSLSNGQSSDYNLPTDLTKLAAASGELYVIDKEQNLFSVAVAQSELKLTDTNLQATNLITIREQLYAINNNLLVSVTTNDKVVVLPFISEQLYLDSNRNIWLLSPYDVQVKWQQNIELVQQQANGLGRFDLYFSEYGLQQGNLFFRDDETGKWQLKAKLPAIADSKEIITTKSTIWLVKENKLIALDKRSYLQTFELDISSKDLVLKVSDNKLMLITISAIVELKGNGLSSVIKSCESSCLPPYDVNAHLLKDKQVLLATNVGLHEFSLESLTFSQVRLDQYNELSAVLGLAEQDNTSTWLLYPNKVALFEQQNLTSDIYYSEQNRLFSMISDSRGETLVLSQKGWFKLQSSESTDAADKETIKLHKVVAGENSIQYLAPESILQLTSTEQELRLAFNLTKQHAEQAVYFRFKYQDEEVWSEATQLAQSITLKNLKQGNNTLLMQARLEGKDWGPTRVFNYQMPYKYLQTKWVVFYAFLALILAATFYLVERYKRFKIAFDTLKQETFIASLLESTKDGVWVANKDREIESVNQAFQEITGFETKEVLGQNFHLDTDSGRNYELESLIWQEVTKVGFWAGEVWSQKKTGEAISIDLSVTRVETLDKVVNKKDVRYVGVFSDVTNRKNSEKTLRQLATRDPLTDLSNRTLFIELIEQAISTANPMNPNFAVMFIDLDNFTKVNASLGPLQGDELINKVAQRLSSDLERGISLARLSGDEFGLLIPNHLFVGEPAFYIRRLAGEIKRKLQPSFLLANTEIHINASIGVAQYPIHGITAESLMRCADTALKKVKTSGKNNFLIYAKELDEAESEVLSIESELIRAFDNDEFKVYYQPKYLVQQHYISGYEALVRWDNPTRGIVAPDQFISIAEQNGLIRQLDSAVLKKVCEQISTWLASGVEFGKVAVNISALNFQQVEFCQTIQSLVNDCGVKPNMLELEITESAMMSDPEQTLANLQELRSLGYTIALDDFGTGHSSLGHLKYFPIDRIKIDMSFVKDIDTSEQSKNIVSVIIQLAKHLNMKVIAEGVENQQQAYILHVLGCSEIQGYLISKPLPAERVLPFLQEQMADLPDIALD